MSLHRRDLLRRLCLSLLAIPVASPLLAACGGGSAESDGSTLPDSTVDSPTTTADGTTSGDWASGGTAAMTAKAAYPDPFTTAATTCALIEAVTEGPCTTTTSATREDVSEGWAGIPVRLGIKLVDSSCNPISGASVKIWHTNKEGIYSGQTPNPGMCNDNNASYIAMNFMRGTQVSDANGVVYFDTCFPGWYNGRAIHIHFQVKNGATTYRVSQLFFPEDLTAAIYTSQPLYKEYGPPNTTFANDNVIAPITGDARSRLVLDYAKMTDGAMLASKVVTVM